MWVYVSTAARAAVTATAHYKSTDTQRTATAADNGTASVEFRISRATRGYTVVVSIAVALGAKHASCATSFTPA